MGNVINHDGTLTDEYHAFQVNLQHKLLDAFKALGMTPICPAFAGFIPRGILRLYPNVKHHKLSWCGFPEKNHGTLLSPEEDLFMTIGGMYIEEYEKEFGTQKFYIADSFNEMNIPTTADRYGWLATMGQRLYKSITDKSPNAVWVIQGWLFSHGRAQWDQKSASSFLSLVPNDGMLILDLATDYNKYYFHKEFSWDFYEGFYGKMWIYSVIPNMGGKSVWTGVLDYYRNGHLTALNDAKKGNLVGIGMAPEGFENDEMLFELYTDVFWSSEERDMEQWLKNYATNRYGSYPSHIEKSWGLLRKSAYNQLVDQIHYNWQYPPGTQQGNACLQQELEECCRYWVSASLETPDLEKSDLYKIDVVEASCHLAGIKLERICKGMIDAFDNKNKTQATMYFHHFSALITMMDHVLAAHPHFRLAEWLDSAEKMAGTNQNLIKHYRESGRHLITVWGPSSYPLYDYAARMWNGLLRDYYYHRWEVWYNGKMNDLDQEMITKNVHDFENGWVADSSLSDAPAPKDVVKACRDLVNFSDSIDLSNWEWA